MAQHDYDIANQSFPAFRTDLNGVLEAINTSNSGTSRPSGAVAGTIWLDTSGGATAHILKFYDGGADINLATINTTANTVDFTDSSVTFDIVNDTSPQLGADLDTNSFNIKIDDAHGIQDDDGNELIVFQKTSSAVNQIDITNAATSNAPEISATGGDTNIDLKLTPKGSGKLDLDGIKFPNADGSNGQALKTDGSGNLSFGDVSVDLTAVASNIVPDTSDSRDLGTTSKVWRNIYTGDLHLSNESKSEGNSIDGTKGNWTIQEGADDLFIVNNKSGKKYKFKLEEV